MYRVHDHQDKAIIAEVDYGGGPGVSLVTFPNSGRCFVWLFDSVLSILGRAPTY